LLETRFSENKKIENESVEHLRAIVPASGAAVPTCLIVFKTASSDESMAPQNILAENSCAVSNMIAHNSLKSFGPQFGAVPFDEKYNMNQGKFSSAGLSSSIIFIGATLLKTDVLI
jgi:hypothetical protein